MGRDFICYVPLFFGFLAVFGGQGKTKSEYEILFSLTQAKEINPFDCVTVTSNQAQKMLSKSEGGRADVQK